VPAAGAAITAAFVYGRLMMPVDGLYGNANYHPNISIAAYLEHAQAFLREAAYGSRWLTPTKSAVLFAAAVVLAIVTRSAALRVALIWMTVGLLPIAFILQRPLAAAYIPVFAMALLLGEAVWQCTWWLARRVPYLTRTRWGVASFAAVLLLMTLVHRKNGRSWQARTAEHRLILHTRHALGPWRANLQRGERTLFLQDPLPGWDWDSLFLAVLIARDPHAPFRPEVGDLTVHTRDKLPKFFPPDARPQFDLVLSQESGRLVECDGRPLAGASVAELAAATCTPLPQWARN
jgi:hypothetical protein